MKNIITAAFLLFYAAPLRAITYEKYTLPNGLTVILHEDHALPEVAINVYYNVGSKHEVAGATGLAHFFEHMMFRQSKNVPHGEFDGRLNRVGATLNAFTSNDETNYFEVFPSHAFDSILQIEADRLCCLEAGINKENIDKERGAVQGERAQRGGEAFGEQYWRAVYGLIYPEGHPYHHPIIGYEEDLDKQGVEHFVAFFRRHYAPNRAVLSIVGDIEPKKVLAAVNRLYAAIPRGQDAPVLSVQSPHQLGGRRELVYKDALTRTKQLMMLYMVPGAKHRGATEMGVAADILGKGANSRLMKALVFDRSLAAETSAGFAGNDETDMLIISATPLPGVDSKEIEAVVLEEIDKLIKDGVTPRELKQVKAANHMAQINGLQGLQSIAQNLGKSQSVYGNPLAFEDELQRMLDLTPEDVRAAAAQYLKKENSAVIYGEPAGN